MKPLLRWIVVCIDPEGIVKFVSYYSGTEDEMKRHLRVLESSSVSDRGTYEALPCV